MDRLKRTDFLKHLSGQVFLSQYDALCTLDPLTAHISESRTPKKTAKSNLWSGPEI